MKAVMVDIEVLRGSAPDPADVAAARERLAAVRAEAGVRREKLERQLGMADEFIAILRRETH
jgi:hypothetical protein